MTELCRPIVQLAGASQGYQLSRKILELLSLLHDVLSKIKDSQYANMLLFLKRENDPVNIEVKGHN